MKINGKKLLIGLLSMVLVGGLFAALGNNEITIKGSTTVLPIAQSCAEVFMNQHSEVNISVQGGGSGVGISSIIDGTAHIGDASRSAKDKEIETAKQNGVDLYENVVAMDGIAVIVHPGNPVSELTLEQIKAIYTGKISDWKDVGGKKGKIVIISRDSSSGTFETFNELALDKERVRPDALMNASNNAVAQIVAKTPAGIGYVGIGYLSSSVKGLTVNSVDPTNENVLNGTYPLARKLFMYTNGKPQGAVADFINFILSKDGQKLVDKAGFVPLQ